MFDSLKTFFGYPFVSVLVGAFVTWLVAWRYYKKAGDELKEEASRLHRTTEIILRRLEAEAHSEIKNVSTSRDEDGVPTGLDYSLSLKDSASATD